VDQSSIRNGEEREALEVLTAKGRTAAKLRPSPPT